MRITRWGLPLMVALMVGAAALPGTARSSVSFGGAYRDGNVAVDVSYFYDELAPYGNWVDYGSYGWCWVPDEVATSWRPYSNGHWIYTDYGWTWASYEPWGWATYHYGRWAFDPDYGWVWVPGTTWAPAWVAWREGDDCLGWAPLPPGTSWSVSVGLNYGSAYYDQIPYQSWCFVPQNRFLDTDLRARIVSFDRNRQLLPVSRDYTRFASRGGWPVNQGIPIASVERSMGRSVPRLRVTDLSGPGRGHGVMVGRDAVGFFRPNLRSGSPRVAPREDARVTVRGRGGAREGVFGRGFQSRGERVGGGGWFDRQPARDDRNPGGAVRERGPDRRVIEQPREVQRPDFGRQREVMGQRMDQRLRERGMERQPVDRGAQGPWGGQSRQIEIDRGGQGPWGGQARPVDRGAQREWNGGQARPDRGAQREWGGGQARPDRGAQWQRPERQQQQPERGNGGGRDRKKDDRGNGGGGDQGHHGHGGK